MDWEETKQRALAVAASIEARCPNVYVGIVVDLMRVNEWKVAMECLCDNLSADPTPLPKDLFEEVRTVARALGLDGQYWATLRIE